MLDQGGAELDAAEQILQRFTAAFAFHRENDAAVEAFGKTTQVVQRRFLLGLHRQIRQGAIIQIGVAGFGGQLFGFQRHTWPGFQFAKQLVNPQP
ncbi:hypothetical protein D3C71_1649980 [compost metagenome]